MANLYIKMLEKFCQGTVFVQSKGRQKKQSKNKKTQKATSKRQNKEMSEIDKVYSRFYYYFVMLWCLA